MPPFPSLSAFPVMIAMSARSFSDAVTALGWRLLFFAGVWFLLSGGHLHSWPFGLAATLMATWLHLRLSPRPVTALRPLAVLRFIPFFMVRSISGGIDVMVRVLHPRLPIDPALLTYPLTIDHDGGRILLANSITLLPGTMSVRLGADAIEVHTLDKGLPVLATIADLERRIMQLYVPDRSARSNRRLS